MVSQPPGIITSRSRSCQSRAFTSQGLFPRNSVVEAAHVVKQLVDEVPKTTPKRQQLQRDIDAKPSRQSAPASESILGTPSSISTAKESSRRRRDRAVDAHFRFRAVGGADAERLGTAAPNSAYSSPRTVPTPCQKLKPIVKVVGVLQLSERRGFPSFFKQI